MMYKYRVIKVNNSKLHGDLYILQKRTLFGKWKSIYNSSYANSVLEKFYERIKNKMPEDEVIIGGS